MVKFCPTCGKQLEFENAEICPSCGVRIPMKSANGVKPESTTNKAFKWVAIGCGGIILLVVIAAVFSYAVLGSGYYSSKSSENQIISSSPYKAPEVTAPAVTTPTVKLIRIESIDDSRNEYDWLVFKGIIVNDDSKSHSVAAYVDLYDKNDIKFDHLLIFEDVDAHGKASFETTSTKSEDYDKVTYKYYIDHVY